MASESAVNPRDGFGSVLRSWRRWWHGHVAGTIDQADVIARRREECGLTGRYLFMLAMSAGIAILGLLLSSPAVVIGAMLLSPLMGPIIGLGFALAIGDVPWLREAGRSLAVGTLVAVAICALIVFLSPLQTVTTEIAARTRPNLFDLLVAVFSALAGAYAMIRGREGTVVGVAIATALMPPLAVVGFGLATFNWTVFTGALLLFATNLIAIALIAAIMARIYGFRTTLSERNTRLQIIGILVTFVALAVPLGFSLMQIRNEAVGARQIRGAVLDGFGGDARLSELLINWDTVPIQVSATVLTPKIQPEAEAIANREIERTIKDPVQLTITQYEVGTGGQSVEEAQLAAARAREEASLQRAERLKTRLALIGGVAETEVLTDREARRAMVAARPLEGATLAAYRELEARIAKTEPEWHIQLRPPARPLPTIEVEDGAPTEAGSAQLALAVWAAQRLSLPVLVSGRARDAEAIVELLRAQGVDGRLAPESAPSGEVRLRWGNPATE